MSESVDKQRELFEQIGSQYEAHYDGKYSHRYRTLFYDRPMFQGIDLNGMRVLEAMCGSGQTTQALIERGAEVVGLDLSPTLVDSFHQRWPEIQAVCASILDSGLESESFDAVVVVGGLHHLHPHVSAAIREIDRVLKPGGYFCFVEPHTGSLPDVVRRWWYQRDPFFEDNEAAIDVGRIERQLGPKYRANRIEYHGTIAYLLVLNSLIFRIPLWLKPIYAPPLILLERCLAKVLRSRLLSCFVAAQFQKEI